MGTASISITTDGVRSDHAIMKLPDALLASKCAVCCDVRATAPAAAWKDNAAAGLRIQPQLR
jgi:hypothetical protein